MSGFSVLRQCQHYPPRPVAPSIIASPSSSPHNSNPPSIQHTYRMHSSPLLTMLTLLLFLTTAIHAQSAVPSGYPACAASCVDKLCPGQYEDLDCICSNVTHIVSCVGSDCAYPAATSAAPFLGFCCTPPSPVPNCAKTWWSQKDVVFLLTVDLSGSPTFTPPPSTAASSATATATATGASVNGGTATATAAHSGGHSATGKGIVFMAGTVAVIIAVGFIMV